MNKRMTEEEYKQAKAEFAKNRTPHIDAVLSDGTRVAAQEIKLSGGGGGGGSGNRSCGGDIINGQKIKIEWVGGGGYGKDE